MYKTLRRDRFKRLYPKRLEKTLWHIRSIGKLSEKTNYVYETKEVENIYSTLFGELERELARFSVNYEICLLYTSPSPRDQRGSRMPASA